MAAAIASAYTLQWGRAVEGAESMDYENFKNAVYDGT